MSENFELCGLASYTTIEAFNLLFSGIPLGGADGLQSPAEPWHGLSWMTVSGIELTASSFPNWQGGQVSRFCPCEEND